MAKGARCADCIYVCRTLACQLWRILPQRRQLWRILPQLCQQKAHPLRIHWLSSPQRCHSRVPHMWTPMVGLSEPQWLAFASASALHVSVHMGAVHAHTRLQIMASSCLDHCKGIICHISLHSRKLLAQEAEAALMRCRAHGWLHPHRDAAVHEPGGLPWQCTQQRWASCSTAAPRRSS